MKCTKCPFSQLFCVNLFNTLWYLIKFNTPGDIDCNFDVLGVDQHLNY